MNRIKIRIKSIIDTVIYITFAIIMLVSLAGVTFSHIDNKQLRVIIQKKNAVIEALVVACKMDYLIKILGEE